MQSPDKKKILIKEWDSKIAAVKIRKEDMNRLVMNFLVTEVPLKSFNDILCLFADRSISMGFTAQIQPAFLLLQGYVEAAHTFEKESGTPPGVDLGAITDRMEIRKAVQSGNVEEAIERVNDLNPEVSISHCTL